MKKFSKVFAFAALAALMASCSEDDLNVGAQFRADKAQLFGTIGGEKTTRTGMFEPTGYLSDRVVWTEGDKARVFTLDALTYHAYNLVDGAGTQTGTFTATSATTLTGKKYAVTDASMVYAVSAADESGNALLTMTIPSSYSVNEEMMGEGIYKFPAPFWGEATEEEKGTDADGNKLYDLTVGFKALVHYLRVDLADIPTGTKAIVLTTHGEDGYQLASKLPADDKVWKAPDETSISSGNPNAPADWSEIPFTTGGASEALSGTVNTVLEEDCFLHVDEQNRLVYSDTLRIDLAEIQRYLEVDPRGQAVEVEQNADQVFWVPILVNTYKNLRVLAVTEDSRFSYCWVGKELACYSDQYFDRSGITDLMQKNVEVPDEVNCRELSEIIREAADGMHTAIVNVKELELTGNEDQDIIYIEDEFVMNNVVLNIEEITRGDGFQIMEASYLPNADYDPLYPYGPNAQYVWKPVLYNRNPDAAERTIEVNLPSEYEEDVNIDTPTSNVEIGTIDKANGLANIKVLAASTKFVSGHDVAFNDSRVLQNYKKASVIVKTGMGSVEIAEGSVGDVYFYSGGQEEAETETLTVTTVNGIAIRISDALIQDIYMMPTSRQERFILTTGSAAFKTLNVHPDATTQNPNLNNVDIQSYWTGAALSEYALQNGYDQKEVWTVAQLASVGEGAPSTYTEGEYEIPTLVTEMWLGGSEYPWIGAEVTVENFKFNGNGVSLQNMTLDTNDATFVDPHHCCTSCGPARKMNLEENLGLFRSINNTESLVENIDLNDVYLKTDAPIDHIGSIVGYVNNDKAQFKNNIIGEVKIDVNGFGVGGMAGAIETKELLAKDNEVTGVGDNDYQPLASGYVISKKSLVGGLIGYAVVEGKADILNTTIKFDDPTATDPTNQIYTEGSCAGGVIGGLSTSGASSIKNANVKVRDKIAADGLSKDYYQVAYDIVNPIAHQIVPERAFTNGEYQFFDFSDWDRTLVDAVAPIAGTQIISCAGGVAGNIESADNIIIMNSNVDVDNEISGNGSFIGGLAAVSSSQKYTRIQDNEVKTALLESYERGTVGGSVGALYSKDSARNLNNKATITNIMANGSSFASGQIGILGTGGHAFVDGNEVNVSGQIYANNQVAAGLIGVSNVFTEGKKLTVLDGKVNVGTIKSENGYAGGAAAVLLNGKSYFGNKDVDLSSKNNRGDSYTPGQYAYTLDIDVATLASAYAVGGIVGKNNPEMYVYTQKWQYSSNKKYGAEVDVDIVKYENTKDESWFATSTDWNKLGTFGNILGYQDAKIDYWTPELHVTNKLDDAMKKAVLYPNHRDRDHTTIVPDLYYWGDSNDSNVGWASNTGLYFKDGVKVQRGDQYNGFNKYCNY